MASPMPQRKRGPMPLHKKLSVSTHNLLWSPLYLTVLIPTLTTSLTLQPTEGQCSPNSPPPSPRSPLPTLNLPRQTNSSPPKIRSYATNLTEFRPPAQGGVPAQGENSPRSILAASLLEHIFTPTGSALGKPTPAPHAPRLVQIIIGRLLAPTP